MKLEPQKLRRVLEVLNLTTHYFTEKGIENPRLNAERLLAHTLECDRVCLYLNHDRPLSLTELEQFKVYVKRRAQYEPLQYIVGRTEFFSLPFKVNSAVLIPRPETELLVEKVIEKVPQRREPPSVLDIGTGSGCIAISLATHLEGCHVTAIDHNIAALEIARENAVANGVSDRISFKEADIMGDISCESPFDVIVSNPPYVSTDDFNELPDEVRLFEPSASLRDGEDGLGFYRRISSLARRLLRPDGLIALEIGLGQSAAVKRLLLDSGVAYVEVCEDLAGIERVLLGQRKS